VNLLPFPRQRESCTVPPYRAGVLLPSNSPRFSLARVSLPSNASFFFFARVFPSEGSTLVRGIPLPRTLGSQRGMRWRGVKDSSLLGYSQSAVVPPFPFPDFNEQSGVSARASSRVMQNPLRVFFFEQLASPARTGLTFLNHNVRQSGYTRPYFITLVFLGLLKGRSFSLCEGLYFQGLKASTLSHSPFLSSAVWGSSPWTVSLVSSARGGKMGEMEGSFPIGRFS